MMNSYSRQKVVLVGIVADTFFENPFDATVVMLVRMLLFVLMILRLLTLHTLGSTFVVVTVVFATLLRGTALAKVSQIGLIHKMLLYGRFVVILGHVGVGKQFAQFFHHVGCQRGWELDVKGDVEISLDKRISKTGHAFALDHGNVGKRSSGFVVLRFALNDLSWSRFDHHVATVQVFDFPLKQISIR